MKKGLVIDSLYPNKYSRWRNISIKFLIQEYNCDVLVFKIDNFAGVNFEFDYNFCNIDSELELENYNILIFDSKYNYLNSYNKQIDGTLFNNRFSGSYLLTKNNTFDLNEYDFIYHIFLKNYINFNNNYIFDQSRQFIHLYPGGWWDASDTQLSKINKNSNIISTHPFTTKILEKNNFLSFIEVKTAPMYSLEEIIQNKNLNINTIRVCFSSIGYGQEKGDSDYCDIAETYKKKFYNDNVKFLSVGNCEKSNFITKYDLMDYISLENFYKENVDIYLNLDTGLAFNGWPLGLEAIKAGCVLITTDKSNVSQFYNLDGEPFFICDGIESIIFTIKKLHDDRELLKNKSILCQRFSLEYSSYEKQQIKIKDFIENLI